MRVCLVGSSGVPIPSEYGGAVERHIYDLAKSLTKRNCEVHVLTLRRKNEAREEVIENIHFHRGGFFAESSSSAASLSKHFTFFFYVLVRSLRLNADLIHAHNGIPGMASLLASRAKRIPFVFTNHTPYTSLHHRIAGESTGLKGRFEDFQVTLEKICAKNASWIIATSRKVRDGLLSISVSSRKVLLVPNGVDIHKFFGDSDQAIKVREKFSLNRRAIVLFVGRIVRSKGLDYLVDAIPQVVSKHPDAKLVIAGPVSYYSLHALTPYYKELTKKIESRQLSDHFLFTGAVGEKDLIGLYSACEMLVLPSLSEGFGMVLVEAMSCGKPVIGSKIDGIVDVINNGEDGYLVSPRKPEELASKINHLLELPKERKNMGEAARKHVEKTFDWNILAPRIMEIYREAIREKRERVTSQT